MATLRDAARSALGRGAPEAATRYLRRALEEPPPEEGRVEVLIELGSATVRTGDVGGLDFLRDAVVAARQQPLRGTAALQLVGALASLGGAPLDEVVTALERGLSNLDEGELATQLEALLLLAGVSAASPHRRVLARLREARAKVVALPLEHARWLMPSLAFDLAGSDGTAEQAARLAERALADGALYRAQATSNVPLAMVAGTALAHAGRLGVATTSADAGIAEIRRSGSRTGLAMAAAHRAMLHYWSGALAAAEDDARTGIELAPDPGRGYATWAVAPLVCVLVERGDLADAREALSGPRAGPELEYMPVQMLRESRAKLAMALGEPAAALAELDALARFEVSWGESTGVVPVQWRSAAALARMALGEADEAAQLAREEVELARRFGARPKLGVSLRALGIVTGGEQGVEQLEEAASVLAGSGAELEHARALVDLGAMLRRLGKRKAALEQLFEAMDIAHRCGASVLAETAHEELRIAGARPRRPARTGAQALTAAERRICEMANEGMTNKEIAQARFVTLRTVEMHLSGAYAKLGISSRRELPAALTPDA